MNRPLLALAGLIVAGGTAGGTLLVASSGGEEEVVQQVETASPSTSPATGATILPQSPTPEPSTTTCDPNRKAPAGSKVWRWGDVTVVISDDSGVVAFGDFGAEAKPFLALYPEEDNSARTVVDAQSGAVLVDHPQGDRESAIEAVVASISVCPLDTDTAPWPYSGEPPQAAQTTIGKLSFLQPDPASGIQVMGATGCGVSSRAGQGCRHALAITNSRSSMYVDLESGNKLEPTKIAPQDQQAFERFLSAATIATP